MHPNAWYSRFAKAAARFCGRPRVFILALLVILVWIVTGPIFQYSDTWQLVINTGTTIVTFLMVFLIQNAQNRDAAALQAKLDEVIRAIDKARNEFIGIEHLSEKQLLDIRDRLEREFGESDPARHEAIEAVIGRR